MGKQRLEHPVATADGPQHALRVAMSAVITDGYFRLESANAPVALPAVLKADELGKAYAHALRTDPLGAA